MKQILKYLQLDPEEQLLVMSATKTGYILSFAVVYLGIAVRTTPTWLDTGSDIQFY